MTTARTIEQAREAGRAAGAAMPPLSQDQADHIAAILAAAPARERSAA